MWVRLVLGWALAGAPESAQTPSRWDLGERIELAASDGISAGELRELSGAAFALAGAAESRSDFWGALGLVAELCRSAPPSAAQAVRARALALLAERDSDSMRWSSLVTRQFMPPFGDLPGTGWRSELAEYERVLTALHSEAATDRVRAELEYARAFGRVFIHRRWDWLTEADRRETLRLLRDLRDRYAALPLPGRPGETVGARAKSHEYELEHLYFGAPAPATAGVDLTGEPIDLADYRGQVVVLDFWTTFCQPCLALVPTARALVRDLAPEPVVYLGVNGDVDRAAGHATAVRVGMNWRNLWDGPDGPEGPAATAWNVPALGWPSVFVLDTEGRIRFKLRGKEQVEDELEGAVRTLLAEREPKNQD